MPLCTNFDVVPGAVLAHPVGARLTGRSFGADRLKNIFHERPCGGASARHHRRAEARALFAAGDAGADKQHSFALEVLRAADGVGEMRVAAVDDEIARLEVRQQRFDKVIHGLARLDHQHDLAGTLQQADHLFDRVGADDVRVSFGCLVQELVDFGHGAVERNHGVAVVGHIQNQVLAHHCQTDQSDICRIFHELRL